MVDLSTARGSVSDPSAARDSALAPTTTHGSPAAAPPTALDSPLTSPATARQSSPAGASASRHAQRADLSAARQSPLLIPSGGVRLLPAASRFVLRGGPAVMAAAGAAAGLKISDTPLTSATQGDRAALWLGPDEQLLLSSVSDGEAMGRQLREALTTLPHSLVDVSHRQIALEVSGPQAQNVLNAGCPLDLHITSFPVGMCTRTVLGKCDMVLWRTGTQTFRVEVWRSFADYASRFLAEAGETL